MNDEIKRAIEFIDDKEKFKIYKTNDFSSNSLKNILATEKDRIKNKKVDMLLYKLNRFYKDFAEGYIIDDKKISNEYEFVNNNGWHCVYISLILKGLVKKYFKIKLNYYQGIYLFENNDRAAWIFGENAIGFHAWCMYKDSILDLTFLNQQNLFLKTSCSDEYLNGKLPKGVIFMGQKESEEIIERYLKNILAINQFTYDEWLNNIENYINKYKKAT